jgi:lipopolysaccharide/colanic/teichoic acid biosynthesis glycosyltransferase
MKRFFDFIVSVNLIFVLIIPLLILAFYIKLKLGGPILFKQIRPGKFGIPFVIYKFRSMTSDTDDAGNLLPDAERLTPLGRWLRSSSLDELPGLWNVLKGEMSLVGPRPLLIEYIPLYSSEQFRRHEVKPGITGWAQVNGRNALTWEDKFAFDVWYVDNRSFILDMRILWMTAKKVFRQEDINAIGEATVSRFIGNNP